MAPQQEPGTACITRGPGESPGNMQWLAEQHEHVILGKNLVACWAHYWQPDLPCPLAGWQLLTGLLFMLTG